MRRGYKRDRLTSGGAEVAVGLLIDRLAGLIEMGSTALLAAALDIPPAAFDPYLDHLAATLAESADPGRA
jgi:hypothetical protein